VQRARSSRLLTLCVWCRRSSTPQQSSAHAKRARGRESRCHCSDGHTLTHSIFSGGRHHAHRVSVSASVSSRYHRLPPFTVQQCTARDTWAWNGAGAVLVQRATANRQRSRLTLVVHGRLTCGFAPCSACLPPTYLLPATLPPHCPGPCGPALSLPVARSAPAASRWGRALPCRQAPQRAACCQRAATVVRACTGSVHGGGARGRRKDAQRRARPGCAAAVPRASCCGGGAFAQRGAWQHQRPLSVATLAPACRALSRAARAQVRELAARTGRALVVFDRGVHDVSSVLAGHPGGSQARARACAATLRRLRAHGGA
jgi:hypothetical protein